MASFGDNKLAICAGVAGVLGAGVLGYVIGGRRNKTLAAEWFNVKSYLAGKNPIMKYVVQHSLREPEPLRKLKEVLRLTKVLCHVNDFHLKPSNNDFLNVNEENVV